MTEAALSLGDLDATERLAPLLAEFEGLNLVAGTLIATFGSADRYLARIASLNRDDTTAERDDRTPEAVLDSWQQAVERIASDERCRFVDALRPYIDRIELELEDEEAIAD